MGNPVTARPANVAEFTLSVPTDAQDDNDVIAATQEVKDFFRRLGTNVVNLNSIVVLDADDQAAEMDLVFMRTNVALGTEDAAVSITDANAAEIIGIVNIPASAYFDLINSQVAVVKDINLMMESDGSQTSIFVAAITRGTPTYASGGIMVKLGYEFMG